MSSFVESLKIKITDAIKKRETAKRDIYRVVLGEIETLCSRQGHVKDEQCLSIVRKLIEKNKECLTSLSEDDARRAKFNEENMLMADLLDKVLTVEEIKIELESVVDQIKAAKSVGQATGVAMKLLKEKKASVTGGDVSQAVTELRV